jgi:hypothetical protein
VVPVRIIFVIVFSYGDLFKDKMQSNQDQVKIKVIICLRMVTRPSPSRPRPPDRIDVIRTKVPAKALDDSAPKRASKKFGTGRARHQQHQGRRPSHPPDFPLGGPADTRRCLPAHARLSPRMPHAPMPRPMLGDDAEKQLAGTLRSSVVAKAQR